MVSRIVKTSKDSLTVEVQIPFGRSLLESEEFIQQALNEAGTVATAQTLGRFDADGNPIEVGSVKFTSKGRLPKTYQTPYGETRVERHVYQGATGGKSYCPLEVTGRIIMTACPLARCSSVNMAENPTLSSQTHPKAGIKTGDWVGVRPREC